MENYKIYVHSTEHGTVEVNTFEEAYLKLKNKCNGTEYSAIGVTKMVDGREASCDIMTRRGNNYAISRDMDKLDNFKDDRLITVNARQILNACMIGDFFG